MERRGTGATCVALASLLLATCAGGRGCGGPGGSGVPAGDAGTGEEVVSMHAPSGTCADDVWTGGEVWTGEGRSAQAFSVADGRFLTVGSDEEVERDRCASTRVHDLAGRRVLPGLVDAHGHLLSLGLADLMLDIDEGDGTQDIAGAVRAAASRRPAGEWIVSRGWDQTRWPGGEFPDASVLDEAAPDHPVMLLRVDGHAAWVNGRALEQASIDADTADPEGGRILRRDDGTPSGILVDEAVEMVRDRIPEPDADTRREAILRASRACVETGLTMVHDAGIDETTWGVLEDLAREGALPIRVYAMVDWDAAGRDDLLDRGPVVAMEDRLWLRAVKLYADGALGSRGAALIAPYADEPDSTGILMMDAAEMDARFGRATEAGFQVAVHAIGDRANRDVISAFERLLEAHPGEDLRPRLEHAQILTPDDVWRIGKLGIIASMQPTHCTTDMRWAERRLGPQRLIGAYAWRSVLKAGAVLAFGSDFPVESPNPFWGIHAAVTREDRTGSPAGGWQTQQRVGVEEAIAGFTSAPARASFNEDRLGSIAAGKLADFVVLDDDPLTATPADLWRTRVAFTVVGGEIAWRREP